MSSENKAKMAGNFAKQDYDHNAPNRVAAQKKMEDRVVVAQKKSVQDIWDRGGNVAFYNFVNKGPS